MQKRAYALDKRIFGILKYFGKSQEANYDNQTFVRQSSCRDDR